MTRLRFWTVALRVVGIVVLVAGMITGTLLILHTSPSNCSTTALGSLCLATERSEMGVGIATCASTIITAVILLALAQMAEALDSLVES